MRERVEFNFKKGKNFYHSLEKNLYLFTQSTYLHVLRGLILATPAKEIKKMKLRQIEKELKTLKTKIEEEK